MDLDAHDDPPTRPPSVLACRMFAIYTFNAERSVGRRPVCTRVRSCICRALRTSTSAFCRSPELLQPSSPPWTSKNNHQGEFPFLDRPNPRISVLHSPCLINNLLLLLFSLRGPAHRFLTRAALPHCLQSLPAFITMEKDSVIRSRLTSASSTYLRFREGFCFSL